MQLRYHETTALPSMLSALGTVILPPPLLHTQYVPHLIKHGLLAFSLSAPTASALRVTALMLFGVVVGRGERSTCAVHSALGARRAPVLCSRSGEVADSIPSSSIDRMPWIWPCTSCVCRGVGRRGGMRWLCRCCACCHRISGSAYLPTRTRDCHAAAGVDDAGR